MTIIVDRNTDLRGLLEIAATASIRFLTVPSWLYSSLAVFKSTSVHKVWHCFPFLGSQKRPALMQTSGICCRINFLMALRLARKETSCIVYTGPSAVERGFTPAVT